MKSKIDFFHPFSSVIAEKDLPAHFTDPFNNEPHPLCIKAAEQLQAFIGTQQWAHNFGLEQEKEGAVIGKMFGVLVVKTKENKIGYLAAFSGKLAGSNHHTGFVPPVFDSLTENSFLNTGMQELTRINEEIKALELSSPVENKKQIELLKSKRRRHSVVLQNKLFDQYAFLNQAGDEKPLRKIFEEAGYKNPPVGAGECAGPKLLQYAFQHQMKPLVLAEFWWGLSPKSATWKHGHYYLPCKEKCEPILGHMLLNLEV